MSTVYEVRTVFDADSAWKDAEGGTIQNIDCGNFKAGTYYLAGLPGAGITLTWKVSNDGSNYKDAKDKSNSAIAALALTNSNENVYYIPDEIFNYRFAYVQLSATTPPDLIFHLALKADDR